MRRSLAGVAGGLSRSGSRWGVSLVQLQEVRRGLAGPGSSGKPARGRNGRRSRRQRQLTRDPEFCELVALGRGDLCRVRDAALVTVPIAQLRHGLAECALAALELTIGGARELELRGGLVTMVDDLLDQFVDAWSKLEIRKENERVLTGIPQKPEALRQPVPQLGALEH